LFNALLTVGKEQRFVLIAQPEGKPSPFLRLGESYAGYTLKTYDAKTSTLELERGGQISHVTLMADAATANAPAATPATIADAAAVMNKIHIDQIVENSMAMQKKAIMASLERASANVPENMKADFADFQKKVADEITRRLEGSAQAMKEDLTRIYSEAFTKEQLDGISAFNDTPLGQVLQSKQPEIQQKIQQA